MSEQNSMPDPDMQRDESAVRKRSELSLRVSSALVMAAVVLFFTWLGGSYFEYLAAAIGLIVYYEYCRMSTASTPARIQILGLAFLILLMAAEIYNLHRLELTVFVAALAGFAIWEWIVVKSAWSPLALVYSLIPFVSISALRSDSSSGLFMVLISFAIVWGADITAYFTGRAIGGPKLAPSISPGKTWSGFCGGMAGSLILSTIIVVLWGKVPTFVFFLVVIVTSVASQIGDLFESAIKRRFNVKDSGHIIPGHGGVLDRIDGLIFAVGLLAFGGWALTGFSVVNGSIRESGGQGSNIPDLLVAAIFG